MQTRRTFLAQSAVLTAFAATAKSYAQIAGANNRLNFAHIGVHGRAYAHLSSMKANAATARVSHVCDVDTTILDKFAADTERELGYAPKKLRDFRELLQAKELDAVTIATPEHWHTPMAIAALQAGKHVYVEKPCSHNPAEAAMLVAAQRKYGKLVQQGSQQRSSPHTIKIIDQIHDGLIGRAYYGKAWYSNVRKSIGVGKVVDVPKTLDWELWQGPAPREEYRDNVHPYNWHWFRTWGTGETLNNGTHEVDLCRWALQVDFPNRVTASGGRYHFHDDWQFYDTLVTSFEYDDKLISWEGKSCEGMRFYGRDRGVCIIGTTGSVVIDRDSYEVYDLNGKKTDEWHMDHVTSSKDTIGADSMTDTHFANFIAAIQTGEKLHAPISEGYVPVTMLQLSNIAWRIQRELHLNPVDGRIQNDPEAMKLWGRQYEPGWEPKL